MTPSLLLIFAIAFGSADPGGNPAGDPISADRAVELFRDVCVSPLSSPDRFVAAMNSLGVRWTKVGPASTNEAFNGRTWRSALGDVTYKQTGLADEIIGAGSSCSFAFRTDSTYAHERATSQVSRAFGLGTETNTGSRKEQQSRWDTQPVNGKFLRYFLTTRASRAGGSQAILAISERRAK